MMCERTGVSRATWVRIEKGDPSVSMGAYAQTLFALGFNTPFGELIDQSRDEQGLLLEIDQLPKRIGRPRRRRGQA